MAKRREIWSQHSSTGQDRPGRRSQRGSKAHLSIARSQHVHQTWKLNCIGRRKCTGSVRQWHLGALNMQEWQWKQVETIESKIYLLHPTSTCTAFIILVIHLTGVFGFLLGCLNHARAHVKHREVCEVFDKTPPPNSTFSIIFHSPSHPWHSRPRPRSAFT